MSKWCPSTAESTLDFDGVLTLERHCLSQVLNFSFGTKDFNPHLIDLRSDVGLFWSTALNNSELPSRFLYASWSFGASIYLLFLVYFRSVSLDASFEIRRHLFDATCFFISQFHT